jgi:hypothetical protein
MKPIYLGNFLWHYVQEYNVQAEPPHPFRHPPR